MQREVCSHQGESLCSSPSKASYIVDSKGQRVLSLLPSNQRLANDFCVIEFGVPFR